MQSEVYTQKGSRFDELQFPLHKDDVSVFEILLCVAHKKQENKISGPDAVLYTRVNPDEFL